MSETSDRPPEERLFEFLFGFMISRAVSAAAELGVPDALADGPLDVTDLADAVGADQSALYRLMRLLAAVGLFDRPEPRAFASTPVSDLLRSDSPTSMRDVAVMLTSESHWLPWGRLADTVRSGASGPQHAFGTDLFSWFQASENREQWALFNAAMSGISSAAGQAVVGSYDFGSFRRIVDVGGGHGSLLQAVLEHAPMARGVLYDLPGVIEGVDRDALGDRIEPVGGDFFESVPAGGDCYLLKHIIHDWDDERCRTILANIASVMEPDGRVLVVDAVMPEGNEPHPAKFMDINMLAMTEGGTERTEREFARLFRSAGLELSAVHPTGGMVNVVEAVQRA